MKHEPLVKPVFFSDVPRLFGAFVPPYSGSAGGETDGDFSEIINLYIRSLLPPMSDKGDVKVRT
ncbi:hypothetical protein [Bacteroides sp. KG122]|uniref:hypothetical protein n=1 Tax=Bacteroides sp. KG122 TaxID=3397827 RepID=UPI003D96F4CF